MSEYRSQQSAELPHGHAASALVMCIVLAGLLGMMFLINSTVTLRYWQPYLGKYSDRIDALVEYGESVTAVFVGSSHILDALSPSDFDAANAELGLPESTYNAAQYGAVMPIQRNTLQTLEQADLPNLRYVFFEPMLMSIPFALDEATQNAFSSRNRYFYDTPTSVKAAGMRWSSDRSFARRAVGVGFIGIAWIIHKANLGVIRDILAPPPRDQSLVTAAWDKRGFTGGSRAPDPSLDFSAPPEMEKGYRQISATELEVLDEFVATIRRAGAEPIFIFPPTRANLGKQRAIRDAVQESYTDIRILDYSYDVRPLDMYFDESLWLDRGHMNPDGARLFSTLLARDWRSQEAATQTR